MITTKLYLKLILILPFFLSFSSHASDSLKVKRTEYYEDGKLVRAIYVDSLGRITKQFYSHYKVDFNDYEQNELTIVKYKAEKIDSYNTYKVNIYGDSVLFVNKFDLGNHYIVLSKNGKKIQEDIYTLQFNDFKHGLMLFSDSLDSFVKKNRFIEKVKFLYNNKGNNSKQTSIEFGVISKIIKNKFDEKNRMTTSTYIDIRQDKKYYFQYNYFENLHTSSTEYYQKRQLKNKFLYKNYIIEGKYLVKTENFSFDLIDSKPIGEPKLTFTQENIFENDRVVKIIYEDILLGKKKVHELKYEFY